MNEFIKSLEKDDIISYFILKNINDEQLKFLIFIVVKFYHEIFRIPHNINSPMVGFLKTTWWKEFISKPQSINNNKKNLADPFLIHNLLHTIGYDQEIVKSLMKIIESLEVIFDMPEINSINIFEKKYILPLSKAYKFLYLSLTNQVSSDQISALFESYITAKFFSNYENLLGHGWEGLSLSESDIKSYLKHNLYKLKMIDQAALNNKCFKILHIGSNFLIQYYINNLPLEKNNYYTPNYGLLRLKLACSLIF